MSSRGKKKTTMAKLSRESRLRERRMEKQAKKNARKQSPVTDVHHPGEEPLDLDSTLDEPVPETQPAASGNA